jgi:DNA-binding NarL/FixJ family response regulator
MQGQHREASRRTRGRDGHGFKFVPNERIKVVIVDEHDGKRSSLRQMIDESRDFECAGAFCEGEEAIVEVAMAGADVALLNIQMQKTSGIECIHQLKMMQPRLVVVLATSLTDHDTMSRAVAAGADGYLVKPFSREQCLTTLRFTVRRCWRPLGRRACATEGTSDPRIRLTARERQVIGGLEKGLLYKEIADELGISFSAVHKHQHKIFTKLGASNRTEAITKWREPQRP